MLVGAEGMLERRGNGRGALEGGQWRGVGFCWSQFGSTGPQVWLVATSGASRNYYCRGRSHIQISNVLWRNYVYMSIVVHWYMRPT